MSAAEDRAGAPGAWRWSAAPRPLVAYGLGRTGSPACRPASLFQWHAVWHVLGAVALASAAEARIERG